MPKDLPEDRRWAVEPTNSANSGTTCMSKRYTVALQSSIGFALCFAIRCNMGVHFVEILSRKDGEVPEFAWTPETISLVESIFFWGYLVTPIPAGILTARYPANKFFGGAIAVTALLNMLIPGAAKLSPGLLMLVRLLQGLAEGFTFPACLGLLSHWAPPLERTRLVTLVISGAYAGAAVGLPLSGMLTEKMGWEACFYIFGILGLIWFAFWQWLSFEKPATHPTISREELVYIESSLGGVFDSKPPTFCTTPWSSIFLSPPFYAIAIANFSRSWTFYLILIAKPLYFKEEFNLDVNYSYLFGSLPHLCMTLVVPLSGYLADRLRMSGSINNTTNVRKLFTCGGFGLEAIAMILLGCLSRENHIFPLFALTLAVIFSGFAISGLNVNHLDIAPQYASTLMGITHTFGIVAGWSCAIVIKFMSSENTSENWSNLFILVGVIQICGVLFYGVFGSGELQKWALPPTNEDIQGRQIELTQV